MDEDRSLLAPHKALRGEEMREPDEVATMIRLYRLGWGVKRIARELGCSHMTVRRYLSAGGWEPYKRPGRHKTLGGYSAWLAERFHRHRGNADVVRQELLQEHGIDVSLRTVERAVAHLRRELEAQARATVRFETPPGRQMQIDFGERRLLIGEEEIRAHLFVATLGWSRRTFVRAFREERQEHWFEGMEGAFAAFGGVTEEVLLDNARALVERHNVATREVVFNAKLHAFAQHWGFRPRACAPFRPRTKGKTENGVGYVKKNAVAGRSFASWSDFEAHLERWTKEIADVRDHGTTGEAPMARFLREEAQAMRPMAGTPPFRTIRELVRKVQNDCVVEIDANAYSVPWRLIGESVRVEIADNRVRIFHAGEQVAAHEQMAGRRRRRVDPEHFAGVAGAAGKIVMPTPPPAALLRPLEEYAEVAGGSW
jgi:transposase